MAYQLGIDLGTTYTAAAVHRNGRVEVLSLGDRSTVIPSVVFVKDDGGVLTGDAANRRGRVEPERVAREFKRRVGDPAPIIIGGVPYSADVLTARLLRSVVDQVAEREGAYPDSLALTHPANWGPYKLDLLRQAVRHSGFGDYPVTYLTEPQAAAIHYATQERIGPGSVIAVYDLGGGTFDAAVLRRMPDGTFEIVGQPEGIERLGGIDFDAAVLAHIDDALDGAVSGLDPEDEEAMQAVGRLRADCIEAKEQLSSDVDVSVPVTLPSLRHTVRLTRSEFENMIRPAINETITALRRALHSATVTPDRAQAVLLVGGSSRIPIVGQMVSAELGRPVAVDAHPKHAIAQGAAVTAAQALGQATADSVTMVHTEEEETPATVAGPVTGPVPLAPPPSGPPAFAAAPSASPSTAPPVAPERFTMQVPTAAAKKRPLVPIAIGAAVVVLLAAIGLIALAGGDGEGGGDTPAEETDGFGAVADKGDMWLASGDDFSGVIKIDRESREVVAHLPIYGVEFEPVIADDFVWAVASPRGSPPTVYQIDRDEATVVNRIELDAPANSLPDPLRVADGIWVRTSPFEGAAAYFHVTDNGDVRKVEVDEQILATSEPAIDGERLFGLTFEGGVFRIEPTGEVTVGAVPGGDGGIVMAGDRLFVLRGDLLHEIDPDSLQILASPAYTEAGESFQFPEDGITGFGPGEFFVDGTTASFATAAEFFQVDLETAEVIQRIELPADVTTLSGGNEVDVEPVGDGVFLAYGAGGGRELLRIDQNEGAAEVLGFEPSNLPLPDLLVVAGEAVILENDAQGLPAVFFVDPESGEVEDEVSVLIWPVIASFAGGTLWAGDPVNGQMTPVDTDELEAGEPFDGFGIAAATGDQVLIPNGQSIIVVDPANPDDRREFDIRDGVISFLVDGDQVWVNGASGSYRFNPASGEILTSAANDPFEGNTQTLPDTGTLTTIGAGAIFDAGSEVVHRIDLATSQATDIAVPGTPAALRVAGGALWVATEDGQVVRFDPATGEQLSAVDVGGGPGYFEVVGDHVWFIEDNGAGAARFDAAEPGDPQDVDLGRPGTATAHVADGSIFIANESTGIVRRFSEFGNEEEEFDIGGRVEGVVGDEEHVFVTRQDTREVFLIDPSSNEVSDPIAIEAE
ncbi:MAG: Hsp70 family protein [Acidimicrobiales bacterium]